MSGGVTIERQIACVRREIGLRRRVYPRWCAAGRITPETAQAEVEAMQAVLATLERLRDAETVRDAPGLFPTA